MPAVTAESGAGSACFGRRIALVAAMSLGAAACSGGRAGHALPDSGVAGDAGGAAGGGGAGGIDGIDGIDGTGGFSIGTVPPFSIPPGPAAGALLPCDSIAAPEVVALLPDGRAVVTQWIPPLDQRLVRLWTFSSNQLETLFVAAGRRDAFEDSGLSVDDQGRYLIEVLTNAASGGTAVRVFDLVVRRFLTAQPLEIAATAVSSDGRYILDRNLQRFTSEGQANFDFGPLVATVLPTTAWSARAWALSRTGNAIAVAVRTAPNGPTSIVVARQDGAGPISLDFGELPCDERRCALSFSSDERLLLLSAAGGLRVWDLDTGAVVSSVDAGITAAAFTPTDRGLVTTGIDGVIERDFDGGVPFTWAIDRSRPFALGPGAILGHRGAGLAVLTRGQAVAEWRHPVRGWQRAVAVTSDASFSIVDDPEARPAKFPDEGAAQMLARFTADRAGPTATFPSGERQTEWEGQLAFSPEGDRLAVSFPDTVRIFRSETLALVTTLATEAGAIAWSPDGRYLAVTPNLHYRDPSRTAYRPTQAVTLWEASSGALAGRYATAVYPRGIAFNETGRALRGWGSDVTITPPPGGGGITTFLPSGEPASFVIDLPSGVVSPLSAPSFVGSARDLVVEEGGIFRLSSGATLATFAGLSPQRATFSADLSVVFVATGFGEGHLYAVGDGHLVAESPFVHGGNPLALSRDGHRLALDESIYCLGGQ